jgi:hypothetical protein
MNWEVSNLPLCKQETPNSSSISQTCMYVHCTVKSIQCKKNYEMFCLTNWIGAERRLNRHIFNNINEINSEKAWVLSYMCSYSLQIDLDHFNQRTFLSRVWRKFAHTAQIELGFSWGSLHVFCFKILKYAGLTHALCLHYVYLLQRPMHVRESFSDQAYHVISVMIHRGKVWQHRSGRPKVILRSKHLQVP